MDEQPIPEALRALAAQLPSVYGDPAHYDVLAQMTAPEDLDFHRALARERGGPILELGCGTGRVALALASEGHEVVGVDAAPALLEAAGAKAEALGVGLTLALGDMRSFDLQRTFPLVLSTYNTLNHLLDADSLRSFFRTVQRHMDASSAFAIDTFQPSLAFLAKPAERRPILRYRDPYTHDEVRLFEENHYEPATQQNRIVWTYEVEGRVVRTDQLTMRIFFPAELEALLSLSGFAIEARYGDYDLRPFGSTSPKQITICRLA